MPSTYISRRIIGLPMQSELYDGNDTLLAQVGYEYDKFEFDKEELQQDISPIQHDYNSYGRDFSRGRGNLTGVTRYDAVTGAAGSITSHTKYNTAGLPVAQIDPLGRTVKIEYNDSFNDNNNSRNTYAYPTKLTDLTNLDNTNNFSTVKYRFDIGANVRAQSPAPAGNTVGKITTRAFDALGRLERESLLKPLTTGGAPEEYAYTRYVYPYQAPQFDPQMKVYSTVTDTNNNGIGDAPDEVLSESWTDGAGRVYKLRTPMSWNTSGATATWSASKAEYDIRGQVKRSTVPTETDGNWNPTGDDNRGFDTNGQPLWLWTSQNYDWKGRVIKSIPTDSTGNDGKEELISYEGCGCAGGQVTTIQSALVPRDDQPNTLARRTQKVYADILGRNYKTEVLNWDNSVYTTTLQSFNGRDRITKTKQYQGTAPTFTGTNVPESLSCPTGTCQEVAMTYDGHGRMKTRRYPIETAGANTVWEYNSDDSLQTVTDPRGVITHFLYNARGLAESVHYTIPANPTHPIPVTPDVSWTYDALGNRVSMADGTGTTNYYYDELSRLTSETKSFTGLSNPLTLNYTYQPGGGLKSYSDPTGKVIAYTNDKTGRLEKVSGTAFGDNTTGNYADNIKYRAWGGLKQLNYKTSDNALVSMSYDNRLRVNAYEVATSAAPNGYLKKANYEYFADASVKRMNDEVFPEFSRDFKYDHLGRLTANNFGQTSNWQTPYSQTVQYNAFSQVTQRQTMHWHEANNVAAAFINGRKQPSYGINPLYDEAGNLIDSNDAGANTGSFQKTNYDGANRSAVSINRYTMRMAVSANWIYQRTITQNYDGDGHAVKQTESLQRLSPQAPPAVAFNSYQVWSSVLGTAVTEINESGNQRTTRVFAGGAVIAEQPSSIDAQGNTTAEGNVVWKHADPVTGSTTTISNVLPGNIHSRTELEPFGQDVNLVAPSEQEPSNPPLPPAHPADNPEWLCQQAPGAKDKGFFNKPVHCQKAILARGTSWQEMTSADTVYNTIRISWGVDSRVKKGNSPWDNNATEKPNTYAKADATTVNPASLPNLFGTINEAVDIPIKFDNESSIDTSDTGGVDAENSGQTRDDYKYPKDRSPLNSVQRLVYTTAMEEAINKLKNQDCFEAVTGVTGKNADILMRNAHLETLAATYSSHSFRKQHGNYVQHDTNLEPPSAVDPIDNNLDFTSSLLLGSSFFNDTVILNRYSVSFKVKTGKKTEIKTLGVGESRIFILLHEIKHLYGTIHPQLEFGGRVFDPQKVKNQSRFNFNASIFQNCFGIKGKVVE